MFELAEMLVMALGCDFIDVLEARDGRFSILHFQRQRREICYIAFFTLPDSVEIEIACESGDLVRALPVCRQHFDRFFGSPPQNP